MTTSDIVIRPVNVDDAAAIAAIYNHYISNSHATFEIERVTDQEIRERITAGLDGGYPFEVAEAAASLVGYASAHQYRARLAYRHTVEISVYVRHDSARQGIGRRLYDRLFTDLRACPDFHVVIAGIALANDASVRLHESLGMRKVAHFTEVGRKFDRWIDVGYWQMIL